MGPRRLAVPLVAGALLAGCGSSRDHTATRPSRAALKAVHFVRQPALTLAVQKRCAKRSKRPAYRMQFVMPAQRRCG